MFESSVNSEGIETESKVENGDWMFESSVNSEGIETAGGDIEQRTGLRAV